MAGSREKLFAVLAVLFACAACGSGDDDSAGNGGAGAGGGGAAPVMAGTSGSMSGGNQSPPAGSSAPRGRDGGREPSTEPPNATDAAVTAPGRDAGAPQTDAGGPAGDCSLCAAYATPMQTGMVAQGELNALSGLAASREQPEIVFAHNDHDRPVVYALDLQGRLHARISLEQADATDIEDIEVGPCGGASCVYLGDVGDNTRVRGEYGVLRFVEPTVPSEPGSTEMSVEFERFRFRYEDGSHNAESLMVGPDGTVYVVTKVAPGTGGSVVANGPSEVYRLEPPLSTTAVAVATKVATLPIPVTGEGAASAATAHPCGLAFLVRTYDRVYEFRAPAGQGFEAAFGVQPDMVVMADESQSEGISYRKDGRGFVTSGEGAQAPLFATDCD